MNEIKRLYKFGRTSFPDVLDRYSIETHYKEGWKGIPLAQDYDVKVIWSRWTTRAEAMQAERWFRKTYPKGFFADTNYNGITECRDWTPQQSYSFFNVLEKKFPKEDFLRENNHKIYYIMLTKKQA